MIKATKRTYAIGLFLLTGWTPWGVQLMWTGMSLCGSESGAEQRKWIMCCGHTMRPAEMDRWFAAGLVIEGEPDRFGRRTVAPGPNLTRWVGESFHYLEARRWSKPERLAA